MYHEFESPVFKRRFMGPKYHSVPDHDVVFSGSSADSFRRIFLESFEIAHQPSSCRRRHCDVCEPGSKFMTECREECSSFSKARM